MPAGSIVIDLLMRTGSFETDTTRAGKRLKAFQKEAESVGKAIGVGLSAAAALAVAAFDQLVKSAANFKDLEETTGASAEGLASLAIAAATAGLSMDEVGQASIKLTKSLTGVDDESKAAGAALTALGIPIEEFKRLDPVAQIDALTKAFAGFADGSQKTAVAVALFGKTGAEQLKLFKALEEQGGRTAILTREQIKLADDYADAQARQIATIRLYAQAGATDLLPVLNDLTGAAKEVAAEFLGIDAAGKKLAGDSPVKEFAEKGAAALAFLVDSGQGVVRIFQAVGVAIGGTIAALSQDVQGNFSAAKQIAAEARADVERILSAELFSQRIARLRAASQRALIPDPNQSQAESARLGRRPSLVFNGTEKKDKKSKGESEAQRYLENLQKQLEKTQELSAYEQALFDIRQKRIKGITPALEAEILAQAKLLDLTKQTKELRDAEVDVNTKRARTKLDELDAINKGNDALKSEIELLGRDAESLAALELQKVRVTAAEKESTLARLEASGVSEQQLQVLQEEIKALREREALLTDRANRQVDVSARENATKTGETYRDTLGDSIADGILDGFRRGQSLTDIFINELKAQFAKTILRPLIQPVADAGNKLIGDIIGAAVGVFTGGGYATNQTGGSLPTAGGAATGTNFVERDMMTILHKGEAVIPKAFNPAAGGGMGGPTVIVNAPPGTQVDRQESRNDGQTLELWLSMAERRVASGIASGTGPAAQAMKSRGIGVDGALARRA